MEDVFHEYGDVGAHRHAEEGHAERENDERLHRSVLPDEAGCPASGWSNIDSLVFSGMKRALMIKSEMTGREKRQRVQPEAPLLAEASPA